MTAHAHRRSCGTCGAWLAADNPGTSCGACDRTRGRPTGPPDVPPGFWLVDHMADALAGRHLGRLIAAYRTHPHHRRPLAQGTVGEWAGLSQSEISRLETGPPVKNLDKLEFWARLLRIPGEHLWFQLADAPPAAPTDLHTGSPTEPRPDPTGLGSTFPVLDLDELLHLAAALENARYFDAASLAFLDRQLTASATADRAGGPRQALPQVLALLATIERQAGDTRPDVRRDFVRLGARAAELAGFFYRDLGQDDGAGYWRDRAFEWAAEIQDLPMCGYVLLRKSQAAWDRREAAKMLALADAADAGPWQLPVGVRAEVAQQQARGHAMLDAPPDVVTAKLDEAWTLAAAPRDPASLGAGYSTTLLTLQTALCHGEAGHPERAVEAFTAALSASTFSERDRGYFLALLGLAHEQAGDVVEAAGVGLDSLAIAQPTSSKRTLTELRRLDRRLPTSTAVPEVHEFRAALAVA